MLCQEAFIINPMAFISEPNQTKAFFHS
uniref:Uncharacterized protein n=1 Tax=Rhizophora mucronata TaxID=61149 RepID=A0A2P2NS37_RHIMU